MDFLVFFSENVDLIEDIDEIDDLIEILEFNFILE